MKRLRWPLLIFILSVLAWYSVIKVSPIIAKEILLSSNECPSGSIAACKDILSALGASGDTFGAVTSLFSGLALFAVAYSIWSDANGRREARKPLVINYLDDSSIVIKNPRITPELQIELSVTSKVSNRNGEAALNVAVHCEISSGQRTLARFVKHLTQPLISDGSEVFEAAIAIKGPELALMLGRLTEDQQPVLATFKIEYNSLENVRWETTVAYELTSKAGDRRRRLNALRSGTDDFASLWENGVQVSLDTRVKEGSWAHARR